MNQGLDKADQCPTVEQLQQALLGVASSSDWSLIEAHLQNCSECDATLDALTEHSDTCVRELCRRPSTEDDEPGFQRLYDQLISSSHLAFRTAVPASSFQLPHALGHYELVSPLGHGANGSVFKARHVPLDRPVVIKLLRPDLDFDSASIERFLQEVRAVGQLNHPHIVRATDAGVTDGQHFLVMEYVPGVDLSTLLASCGPLKPADACEILRQAALGLAYLHENGFVHRDVKPSNLLLTANGQVKLLDLGLVQHIQRDADASGQQNQLPHGTADYMSPEQWERFDDVESRSDLYSLGCTLGKLLTGTPPYRPLPEGYATKSAAHRTAPIPQLTLERSGRSDAMQALFEQLLAKDPNARTSSAADLASKLVPLSTGADLVHLAERTGLEPAPASGEVALPVTGGPKITRRYAVAAGAFALAGLALSWPAMRRRWDRRSAAQSLQSNVWRALEPVAPTILLPHEAGESGRWDSVGESDVVLTTPALTLLNLGRPIADAYRLRVSIVLPMGHSNAGLFFQFVEDQRDSAYSGDESRDEEFAAVRFQTIELVRDELAGHARYRFVWSVMRVDHQPSAPSISRILMAQSVLDGSLDEGVYSLTANLGSSAAPQVYWVGQPIEWEFSFEGRSALSDGLRSKRLGRLGLMAGADTEAGPPSSETVATTFRQPQLSYAPSSTTT